MSFSHLIINLSILVFSAFDLAFAKEVTVFDVRRPLAMDNSEQPPKDYYINAGSKDGLKSGMVLSVNRRSTLYDQYQNKSPGDLIVLVGVIRLIHVQEDISVARLEKIESRDKLPTIDFDAIMMGDKVDLNSAKMKAANTDSLENTVVAIDMIDASVGP